ncbi:MAG: hypothetical protein RR960_05000, partial [Alistipes sp.]
EDRVLPSDLCDLSTSLRSGNFQVPLRPLDRLEERERFLFETSINQSVNKKFRLILHEGLCTSS